MKHAVKDIKVIKSIVDLLNEYYPPFIIERKYDDGKVLLEHHFTAYFEDNKWIICCSNYWIFSNTDCKELQNNLIQIAKEDNVDIVFYPKHCVTQILRRKSNILNKEIFIGRAEIMDYHS